MVWILGQVVKAWILSFGLLHMPWVCSQFSLFSKYLLGFSSVCKTVDEKENSGLVRPGTLYSFAALCRVHKYSMCPGKDWVFMAIYTCPSAPGEEDSNSSEEQWTTVPQMNSHLFKTGLLRCVGGMGFCPKHQTRESKQVPWGLCSSVHAPAIGAGQTAWCKPSPRHFGMERQKVVKWLHRE